MPYYRVRLPIEAYYFMFGALILVGLISVLGVHMIWISAIIIILSIAGYLYWNHQRWQTIEQLNQGLGISKKTVYIDRHKYLRWKETNRLCHRDIAWEHGVRGNVKFGEADIHHKDGNHFNNQPSNLEALSREQHMHEHGQIVHIRGKKYYKFAGIEKIYHETAKAYMVGGKSIPKSQSIVHNGVLYITEWLYFKK